ncbi:MAG: tRNA pseudouridine(55) synthase TruB [Candidatus Phytoplasma stylosanthis]|uniref:tRNA pseudouridine(55) synthase TruB n=1 Tax=Candidatus Phytoplasma stylosanthis TaxID=2798314 RepID=UPI00293A5F1B|nr:tRNA pseudouridine(55) synthase TruB [Candidatus Phytoplasma stylosanthis]MDV3167874.1 tRNA pseudouridine(55) synthase TruB [Candidatus Phytoplasma stylosanthis]MDV3170850.1 tRNA pseudouridine(55) synthase TruB [Candidatus Phytoplasma stylosanthis]MDV3173524.1 tRNA pseudouridine(55) synthase TruB [Candidatus Phytoplasma stylosanthis]MDV3174030.1 tRNA pseudouridine(55) synthase TruB [Candidatus Phytoplasma stylosanthis]MDV3202458.1 tRNA pseudouridine(55) synthase TruB [Candidatus Phytoplasma
MDGIFLVNKEKNMTSHDIVNLIKKKFNFQKVGHTGTLDPLAEGLLIILVNKATKLTFLFENLNKKYVGSIIFNYNYDTLDINGKILDKSNAFISEQKIKKVFSYFNKKKYLQTPPMYSAIKIRGEKMYNLARKNIKIKIPPREIYIHNLKMLGRLKNNIIQFQTNVSKGTYIRSLARDIADKMNTYGALNSLTRTKIGPYNLNKAQKIESISLNNLINHKILFQKKQKIILSDYLINLVKNGIILDQRQIITTQSFVVMDQKKNYIAYYQPIEKNKYSVKYFF